MARFGVAGASILTGLFMALAVPAAAQPMAPPVAESFPACYDSAGTPVRYVSDEEVNVVPWVFFAGARYLNASTVTEPAIVYEPEKIAALSPVGRAFVFAHECYHLSSGDAMEAYRQQNETGRYFTEEKREIIEANADCDAAHRLRDEYRFTLSDIESLHDLIRRVHSDDDEKRIAHIMACYADGPQI